MEIRTWDRPEIRLERLKRYVQQRTTLGGIGIILLTAGGYILGDAPAILIGGIITGLWIRGNTPVAIIIGIIGITGITKSVATSTILGATPMTFPSPSIGVVILGIGIIGLLLEPIVTAHHPTQGFRIGGVLVIIIFASLLTTAHLEKVSTYLTAAIASGIVIFLTGVLDRTATLQTKAQEWEYE